MQCRGMTGLGLSAVMAVVAATPFAVGTATAKHPVPNAASRRPELIFKPGELRLYVDETDAQTYWFFSYKITNRTGAAQIWAPGFALMTDAGEILASGRGVPTRVTDDIRRLLGNPLLETQNEIIGEIFHGRENAKEGLVIWPAGNLEVNQMSLFIGGISPETAQIEHPITGETLLLRKTLKRDYLIPGEALPRGAKPVTCLRETWVMR